METSSESKYCDSLRAVLESLGLSDTDAGRVELLIADDMAKAPSLIKSLALLRSPYRSPDAPRTDQRLRRPLTPLLRCADDGLDLLSLKVLFRALYSPIVTPLYHFCTTQNG